MATALLSDRTTLDPRQRRPRLEAHFGALRSERMSSFDSHWRDLADHIRPRRTRWFPGDQNKGDKRSQKILDSTATFAARTLQSGMHAGLTSPARPWMKLTTPDPRLAKQGAVRVWLHEVTQRMLMMFEATNLYNVLPTVYGDMGTFGTAAMSVIEDTRDVFRAYAYPVGSYVLGQDRRGMVSSFFREYQLSVRQVVTEFALLEDKRTIDWTRVSRTVRSLWDAGKYEAPVQLVWAVVPNDEGRPHALAARDLPFSSLYWERGADASGFLRESGFNEFPIMAPRWDITGEDSYGTDCPGMTVLGDVRQLQIMQRKKAQGIAKMVDPALVGPSSLQTQKTSLLPGDVTYNDVREGMQGLRPIHEVTLNLQHLGLDIRDTQGRVQRGYYEDLFLMLAQMDDRGGVQPITAREVDERHEEKLLALGPVLERTNDELLDPLVDRVYGVLDRAGMIPPAPEQIHGVKLKVEYLSILAQAQKLVGVTGQDRLVQTVIGMVQVWPESRTKIDVMRLIDNYADMLGVDPEVVIDSDTAKAVVAQQAKIAQGQASAAQALTTAQAAKAAAAAPMGGDTALSRIIGNVTGAGAGGAALAGG